jgi:hypothetical protein
MSVQWISSVQACPIQHRTQDFDFILQGLVGILEVQMASYNNLLPGSRKGVPYILETGMFIGHHYAAEGHFHMYFLVIFLWKMIELNKVNSTKHSRQAR